MKAIDESFAQEELTKKLRAELKKSRESAKNQDKELLFMLDEVEKAQEAKRALQSKLDVPEATFVKESSAHEAASNKLYAQLKNSKAITEE